MVSTFRSVTDPSPASANLEAILRGIKEGRWQEIVAPVAAEHDKRKRSALKKNLPSFTPSGTFKGNTDASLVQHSGFIAMDFDDPSDHFAELIGADPYTYSMFHSVSGIGFCVIVRIDPTKHAESFIELADYYRSKYNEIVDPSCSNISRKRFVSHDPDLVLNESSSIFKTSPVKARANEKPLPLLNVRSDFELLVNAIVQARLDVTDTYQNWIFVGMACRDYDSGPNGLQLFKNLSQFHPAYNPSDCNKKWLQLPRPRSIKHNYLFERAARHGITIENPVAQELVAAVQVAKAAGKTAGDAIKSVNNLSNKTLDPEYTELAEKSFSSGFPTRTGNPLQLARQYLSMNCNLWECEITRRVYDNDAEVTERYLNNLWENINNQGIRINPDNLSRLVYSSRNTSRNMLKEWLMDVRCSGVDAIDALVNSLTVNDNFGYILIHKWLVSVINNVFNDRSSPYMLVLCGSQNTGKTSWFRGLLPKNQSHWYAESKLEEGKDDLRLLTEKLIVLNDEFSGRTIKEAAMYKDILSKDTFTFRVPYGRTNEQFKRIASLAGTSNPTEIISDLTGNRRIFPVEVTQPVNWTVYNAVDRNRFWGQLYNIYCEGFPYELTQEEISKLNQYSENYSESIIEEDLIRRKLQPDHEGRGMTTTEILIHFEAHTRTRLGTKKIGLAMQKHGYIQTIKTYNSRTIRAWNCRPVDPLSSI